MSHEDAEMRLVRRTGHGVWQLCWVQYREDRWHMITSVRLHAVTSNDNPDELHLLKLLGGFHAAMGEALHKSPIDSETGQEITLGEQTEPQEEIDP